MHQLRLSEKVKVGCALLLLISCVSGRMTEFIYIFLKGKNGTSPEGSIVGHNYLGSSFLSISLIIGFQRRYITHRGVKMMRIALFTMIFVFFCGGYLCLRDLRAAGSKGFYFLLALDIALVVLFGFVKMSKVTQDERKLLLESNIVNRETDEQLQEQLELWQSNSPPIEITEQDFVKQAKLAALMEVSILSSVVTLGTQEVNGANSLRNDYMFSVNYLQSTFGKAVFLCLATASCLSITVLLNMLIFAESKTTHKVERFWLSLALAVSAAVDFISYLVW